MLTSEFGEGDGVLTAPEQSQEGDAVREELAKIMGDTTHPMHEPFKRREKKADEYIEALYKKAYPATEPRQASTSTTGERASLSQDEREAAEDAYELEQLRADWERDGGYEGGLKEAREMAFVLYNADPQLYLEASRRLGDAMGLRLLRMLRQRVNL